MHLREAIEEAQNAMMRVAAAFAFLAQPAPTGEPRFAMTYCSQCGKELGPGNEGVSHCSDHKSL